MQNYTNWLVEQKTSELPSAFYFKKLWSITQFRNLFKKRYLELRCKNYILSDHNIQKTISELSNKIELYAKKDTEIWHKKINFIFHSFLNTNKKTKSFIGNVNILQEWMLRRLHWIDNNI